MCVDVLPMCGSVHHISAVAHRVQKQGVGSPEITVTNGCELPRGYWDGNPSPLEEQLVYLIIAPSFRLPLSVYRDIFPFGILTYDGISVCLVMRNKITS